MAKLHDLTGQKFTRLLVLSLSNRSTKKVKYWLCQCDCGNKIDVAYSSLKAKNGTKSCGCLRSELRRKSGKNYIGKKFGMLTVLKRNFSKRNDHNIYWECECECGNTAIVSITSLKKGDTISCGCFCKKQAKIRAKNLNIKNEGESALNSILYTYKYNANKRNIEFDLTNDQFELLIFSDCKYCGMPPNNLSKNRYGNGDVIYNGVDRMNNSIGYKEGNCVSCCKNCNRAKSNMSYEEFMSWIKNIYERFSNSKTSG